MSQLKNILTIPQGSPIPPGITILPYCYFKQGCINTGILTASTFSRFEISFSYNHSSNGYWEWGSRTSSSSNDRFQAQDATSGITIIIKTTNHILNVTDKKKRMDLMYDGSTLSVTNEGSTVTASYSGFPNGSYNLYIGRVNNGGSYSSTGLIGYFYLCRIYDSGILLAEFLPAKDANNNNAIGLYNSVNQQMYFPIVGTIVENP